MRLRPVQSTPEPTYPTKRFPPKTIARKIGRVAAIAGLSLALAAGSLGCAGSAAGADEAPAEIVVVEQQETELEQADPPEAPEEQAQPLPSPDEEGEVRLRGRIPSTSLPRHQETTNGGHSSSTPRPASAPHDLNSSATTTPSTVVEARPRPRPRPRPRAVGGEWQERLAGGLRAPGLD